SFCRLSRSLTNLVMVTRLVSASCFTYSPHGVSPPRLSARSTSEQPLTESATVSAAIATATGPVLPTVPIIRLLLFSGRAGTPRDHLAPVRVSLEPGAPGIISCPGEPGRGRAAFVRAVAGNSAGDQPQRDVEFGGGERAVLADHRRLERFGGAADDAALAARGHHQVADARRRLRGDHRPEPAPADRRRAVEHLEVRAERLPPGGGHLCRGACLGVDVP